MSEEDHPKLKLFLVGLLVASLIVGVVFAVGYVMTSNPVSVHVEEETLALTVNGGSSATIQKTGTVTLNATCSDNSYTGQVTFKENGNTIAVVTAVAGVASYNWTVGTAGTYTVTATAPYP